MHGKLIPSRAEMADKKAASNRRKGRGGIPDHPPNKVGLDKSMLLGRLAGIEAVSGDKYMMGYLEYRKSKGSPPRQVRASPLH